MRTNGMEIVSAEVSPYLKNALIEYAQNKGISSSEAVRNILTSFFAFSVDVKELKEGEK